MTAQTTLFATLMDTALAESEMRRGTELALYPASQWTEEATEWVLAHSAGDTITADDMAVYVGLPTEWESSASGNNALGGLFMRLARQGVIRPVGYAKSARVSSRGRMVRVWERVSSLERG